jgi:hypothetical protein
VNPPGDVEELQPDPAALIESMRAFGYSLATAVADLIDNSIAADAADIRLTFDWAGSASTLTILDDGHGMTEPVLVTAMRLGSRSPTETRDPRDLGRFGLGLKSAAWSQARVLTVISRPEGGAVALRRWDLDHVTAVGRWELQSRGSESAAALIDVLAGRSRGTAVLLENPDRMVGIADIDDDRARARFFAAVEGVRSHLAVVFHRFLSGRSAISIRINEEPVPAWDPFLEQHPSTQRLGEETLWQAGHPVTVSPFVLPHQSRLDDDQHRGAAGMGGWNAQQGFYVYRARRLLVAGGWLNLPRMQQEEHYKLARIRIDIDNAVDDLWQIDVRKARARIPGALQPDLQRIARVTRARASEVYRFRGKLAAREPGRKTALKFVWQPHTTRDGRVFRVNRDHPVLAALSAASPETRQAIETALRLVEEHLPIEALLIESRERERESPVTPYAGDEHEIEALLRSTVAAIAATGTPERVALEAVAGAEPFDDYPDIVQVLREEMRDDG